jgi:hypothetical protein
MTPSLNNSELPNQPSIESSNEEPGHTLPDELPELFRVSCCGSYDPVTDEYCFTVTSGGLCISFEFLKKEDVEEMKSCIECLLLSEQPTFTFIQTT